MNQINRRNFIAAATGFAGLALLPGARAATDANYFRGLKVGLATYSLRNLKLDEMIPVIVDLGVRYVSLKDFHLPMKSTKAEIEAVVQKLKDAGITVLSGGVIALKGDEATMRASFDYARWAGMGTMVVSFDPALLAQVEKLAKEYDVKIAIHNHGPGDKFWPSVIEGWERVKNLDARMGFCVDIGHCYRQGEDEVKAVALVKSRLFDMHFKDYVKTAAGKFEMAIPGEGGINLKGVLKELLAMKYEGHVGLEYEKAGPNLNAELKANFAALAKMLAEI